MTATPAPAPAVATHSTQPGLPASHPIRDGRTTGSALIAAYRGQRPATRPVWFMRQAGRSLPEYRTVRGTTGMLEACLTPDLATEITLQPVRRHRVDAAILFSDIVVPLKLAGIDVEIVPGTGPVVAHPVRTAAEVAALPPLDPAALAPIIEAAAATAQALGTIPLIGFAGAPFTVASYLVEGGPSREHLKTKAMMHGDPATWDALAAWVAGVTTAFLRAQAVAGASAVQLFDSWAGALSLTDYTRFVAPHSAAVLSGVADLGIPRVHFGVGTGELLAAMRDAGADVMGVDHRVPLDTANNRLGGRTPLQGNIDPALLFAGPAALHAQAADVIRRGAAAPGHVVNLGHGVPPDTDPDVLTRLVEFVHTFE
jgi:uroporphyrinogen decarboxylase